MKLCLIKCIHKGVAGMKTAQQIIGLPVVSIIDGNEIGKVKNVIINALKGTIDFFVIDSGVRSLSGGVIPADRVLGIGEYALTILQPDDISDIVKIPAAIELMQKNITVRGTRVLTQKGSLLGETGDIIVNEQDAYNITGVEFVPADSSIKSGIIPRSSIITFGKDLLVVQDDFIDQLIESTNAIQEVLGAEKKNIRLEEEKPTNSIILPEEVSQEVAKEVALEIVQEAREEAKSDITEISIDRDLEISFESNEEAVSTVELETETQIGTDTVEITSMNDTETEQPLTSADLFEERQRQFLIGKKVTKSIYDSDGGVIINSGDLISEEIIEKVKANGKIIELVMNYEE